MFKKDNNKLNYKKEVKKNNVDCNNGSKTLLRLKTRYIQIGFMVLTRCKKIFIGQTRAI